MCHLVKDLHSSVDDLQLEPLLVEILHPKVDGASIQGPKEANGANESCHTYEVVQLASPGMGSAAGPCLGMQAARQTRQGSQHSEGKHGKDSLHMAFIA